MHRPIVLLAGGRDKNLPWDGLAELIHERVEHLILFGEAAGKIARSVGNSAIQVCDLFQLNVCMV